MPSEGVICRRSLSGKGQSDYTHHERNQVRRQVRAVSSDCDRSCQICSGSLRTDENKSYHGDTFELVHGLLVSLIFSHAIIVIVTVVVPSTMVHDIVSSLAQASAFVPEERVVVLMNCSQCSRWLFPSGVLYDLSPQLLKH